MDARLPGALRALAALGAAAVLFGCAEGAGEPVGDALFPLDEGRKWHYRVEWRDAQGVRLSERSVEVAGDAELEGERFQIRRWSDGVDFYVRTDARGTYRRAKRTFIETAPRLDAAPRFVVKAPYTVETNWTSYSHPYLLWRPGPIKYDYARLHTVQMTYTIVSTDAAVTVPAGHFTGCLLVEGEAILDVHTGPVSGTRAVPLNTREWYAPGVGLVKVERIEALDASTVKGGEWRMELTAWR